MAWVCEIGEFSSIAFDRVGLPVAALADFWMDVVVNVDNSKDKDHTVALLGMIGLRCLWLSCFVNFIILLRHVYQNEEVYSFYWKAGIGPRVTLFVWGLISCTNIETMQLYHVIWGRLFQCCSSIWSPLDRQRQNTISIVSMHIKRHALFSQLFENVPELVIQTIAILLKLKSGASITILAIVSVFSSFGMLFGKMLLNVMANAFVQDAPDQMMIDIINSHGQDESWRLTSPLRSVFRRHWLLDWVLLLQSLPCTIATCVLLGKACLHAGIGDHSLLMISIYATASCGFLLMLHFVILISFFRSGTRLDHAWHLQLHLVPTCLVLVMSMFAPRMMGSIYPAWAKDIFTHAAGVLTFVRTMVFCLLLAATFVFDNSQVEQQAAFILEANTTGFNRLIKGTMFSNFKMPEDIVKKVLKYLHDSPHIMQLLILHVFSLSLLAMIYCTTQSVVSSAYKALDMAPSRASSVSNRNSYTELSSQDGEELQRGKLKLDDFNRAAQHKIEEFQESLKEMMYGRKVVPDQDVEDKIEESTNAISSGDQTLKAFQQWRNDRIEIRGKLERAGNTTALSAMDARIKERKVDEVETDLLHFLEELAGAKKYLLDLEENQKKYDMLYEKLWDAKNRWKEEDARKKREEDEAHAARAAREKQEQRRREEEERRRRELQQKKKCCGLLQH